MILFDFHISFYNDYNDVRGLVSERDLCEIYALGKIYLFNALLWTSNQALIGVVKSTYVSFSRQHWQGLLEESRGGLLIRLK